MWDVSREGRGDLEVALEGVDALAAFIAEMGLPTTFVELGGASDDETLRAVADTAILTAGCAKRFTAEEIFEILCECH